MSDRRCAQGTGGAGSAGGEGAKDAIRMAERERTSGSMQEEAAKEGWTGKGTNEKGSGEANGEQYACDFHCGYMGSFACVDAHERVCSPRLELGMTGESADTHLTGSSSSKTGADKELGTFDSRLWSMETSILLSQTTRHITPPGREEGLEQHEVEEEGLVDVGDARERSERALREGKTGISMVARARAQNQELHDAAQELLDSLAESRRLSKSASISPAKASAWSQAFWETQGECLEERREEGRRERREKGSEGDQCEMSEGSSSWSKQDSNDGEDSDKLDLQAERETRLWKQVFRNVVDELQVKHGRRLRGS